jgi:hypothetical protein
LLTVLWVLNQCLLCRTQYAERNDDSLSLSLYIYIYVCVCVCVCVRAARMCGKTSFGELRPLIYFINFHALNK